MPIQYKRNGVQCDSAQLGAWMTGWRPSGEVALSISLDDAGHYALNSSFKLASLPPDFQRVAIVQSGFTIKF